MSRPKICRRVSCNPRALHFKPQGIPLSGLEVVNLGVDELEALRLAHLEGLSQEGAAERMGISRATVGRILESAHRRVAEALLHGKAIAIEGGEIEMTAEPRVFECLNCHHRWGEAFGTGRPAACPSCGSRNIRRAPDEACGRGHGRGRCRGEGRGRRRGRTQSPVRGQED